jgi:hypothetical protein
MKTFFSATMGRLGTTVTGTIRVLLAAIPNFNVTKKGDSK